MIYVLCAYIKNKSSSSGHQLLLIFYVPEKVMQTQAFSLQPDLYKPDLNNFYVYHI